MARRQNSRSGARPIPFLVIVLSVYALTASLVTRTFHFSVSRCVTAQAYSPQAVRQHLDRDATRWADPIPKIAPFQASNFDSCVPAAIVPLPSPLLDENLYNRPPPFC